MSAWLTNFWALYLVPALDILLVAFICYRIIRLVQGTVAVQVIRGLIVLAGLTFLATQVLHLPALGWLLRKFWLAGALAFVVIFQPELRAAIAALGGPRRDGAKGTAAPATPGAPPAPPQPAQSSTDEIETRLIALGVAILLWFYVTR